MILARRHIGKHARRPTPGDPIDLYLRARRHGFNFQLSAKL